MKYGLILTGCGGFLGVNVLLKITEDFRKKYDRIISIDKLGYSTVFNREIYSELCDSHNIERLNININDTCNHIKFSANYEWDVLDLASENYLDNNIKNTFEENVTMPARFLSAFDDLNSIRTYYHISCGSVYGNLPVDVDEKEWFSTSSAFNPANLHSASKVAQDAYLMAIRKVHNIPISFIRISDLFGNFQHPSLMLPSSCLRAFSGESIKLYGSGLHKRQWTPVDITAEIILDKVSKLEKLDILHIANNKGLTSDTDIVYFLSEVIGISTGETPQIEYVPDSGNPDRCNALKTTEEIDSWFKNVNLSDELAKTAEFYFMKKEDYR